MAHGRCRQAPRIRCCAGRLNIEPNTLLRIRSVREIVAPLPYFTQLSPTTTGPVSTGLAVHGPERLPVVTDTATLQLVGIVSRSDLLKLHLPFLTKITRKNASSACGSPTATGTFHRF